MALERVGNGRNEHAHVCVYRRDPVDPEKAGRQHARVRFAAGHRRGVWLRAAEETHFSRPALDDDVRILLGSLVKAVVKLPHHVRRRLARQPVHVEVRVLFVGHVSDQTGRRERAHQLGADLICPHVLEADVLVQTDEADGILLLRDLPPVSEGHRKQGRGMARLAVVRVSRVAGPRVPLHADDPRRLVVPVQIKLLHVRNLDGQHELQAGTDRPVFPARYGQSPPPRRDTVPPGLRHQRPGVELLPDGGDALARLDLLDQVGLPDGQEVAADQADLVELGVGLEGGVLAGVGLGLPGVQALEAPQLGGQRDGQVDGGLPQGQHVPVHGVALQVVDDVEWAPVDKLARREGGAEVLEVLLRVVDRQLRARLLVPEDRVVARRRVVTALDLPEPLVLPRLVFVLLLHDPLERLPLPGRPVRRVFDEDAELRGRHAGPAAALDERLEIARLVEADDEVAGRHVDAFLEHACRHQEVLPPAPEVVERLDVLLPAEVQEIRPPARNLRRAHHGANSIAVAGARVDRQYVRQHGDGRPLGGKHDAYRVVARVRPE